MLTVRNLNTVHGKIQALWDVSIEVEEGEVVALVGANGGVISRYFTEYRGLSFRIWKCRVPGSADRWKISRLHR